MTDKDRIEEAREFATRSPLGRPQARELDRAIRTIRDLADALEARSESYTELLADYEAMKARTAAGVTPQEPDIGPKDMSIMNGWLVESVGEHTCGAGMDGYGHEPGCGYVPVLNLAELDGYPKQTAEALERVSRLHRVVLRGNAMRGEELKAWCGHCDTAYPCQTMQAAEVEHVCECYGADGLTDPKSPACAALVQVDEAKLAEAMHKVEGVHQIHGEECLCGFKSSRSRSRTEHITQALAGRLRGVGR